MSSAALMQLSDADLRAIGLPPEVVRVPGHLKAFGGRYADKTLWSKLVGVQQDEKDIFRVEGKAGLPDWGDGRTTSLIKEYDDSLAALDDSTKNIYKTPASTTLGIAVVLK